MIFIFILKMGNYMIVWHAFYVLNCLYAHHYTYLFIFEKVKGHLNGNSSGMESWNPESRESLGWGELWVPSATLPMCFYALVQEDYQK